LLSRERLASLILKNRDSYLGKISLHSCHIDSCCLGRGWLAWFLRMETATWEGSRLTNWTGWCKKLSVSATGRFFNPQSYSFIVNQYVIGKKGVIFNQQYVFSKVKF
jgi:hypothetical protein